MRGDFVLVELAISIACRAEAFRSDGTGSFPAGGPWGHVWEDGSDPYFPLGGSTGRKGGHAVGGSALQGAPPGDGRLLQTFCNAGLQFLVAAHDLTSLAQFVDYCDDGRALVVQAMLEHGLEFDAVGERKSAFDFLVGVAGSLERDANSLREQVEQGQLAVQCIMFLKDKAFKERWSLASAAEGALVSLAAEWAGVHGGATSHLIRALSQVLERGGDHQTSKSAIWFLARLAIDVKSKESFAVLASTALRVPDAEARAYAAQSLGEVVLALRREPGDGERSSQCIAALWALALGDESRDARHGAAFAVSHVATSLEDAPANSTMQMRCVEAMRDMALQGLDEVDRSFAAWRLFEMANALQGSRADATSECIAVLARIARESDDGELRLYAASMLEHLAVSLRGEKGLSTQCIEALKEMAVSGRQASDRSAAASRLFDTACSLEADHASQCLEALSDVAQQDRDGDVREHAAQLLHEILALACGAERDVRPEGGRREHRRGGRGYRGSQ